jgi:hypothetical protein
MTIACFPKSEAQLHGIAERLKAVGLGKQYEEQAHGESVLISIRTRTFDEREMVKTILQEAGITEFVYGDESAA